MSDLQEAVIDFLDSCYRSGHFDLDDNIDYFMRENSHMNLDIDEVRTIFEEQA